LPDDTFVLGFHVQLSSSAEFYNGKVSRERMHQVSDGVRDLRGMQKSPGIYFNLILFNTKFVHEVRKRRRKKWNETKM